MQLQLKIQDKICHQTAAAFLRGGDPARWLEEIDSWQLDADQMEAYLVPEGIHSTKVAGLFIVFKSGLAPKNITLLDAYGLVGARLYLPVQAKLFPEVTQRELADQLLYDRNFLHPMIGLVGFSKSEDQLNWATLLQMGAQENRNWGFAMPRVGKKAPRLKQITLDQPPGLSFMESLRKDIDPRSPDDIPEDKKDILQNLKDKAIDKTVSAGRNLLGRMGRGLSGAGGGLGGMLGGLGGLMASGLSALERMRNDEINRLLNLFETNLEEALRYSIPLDDQYEGRGKAPPSGRLFRWDKIDFNLGNLGGGQPRDGWDLGNRFFDLRKRYLEAAQRMIQEGKFRKAAYIYAHLLGDFTSAANVLVQGKHFREAAELYEKHLKDLPAAAKCLEDGGLLLEAIEIYRKLGKEEKMGDLYHTLKMEEEAMKCYWDCAYRALDNDDFLEAARILDVKMNQWDRANELLLDGWGKSLQGQSCLQEYFRRLQDRNEDSIAPEVQRIFIQKTRQDQRPLFLNVLLNMPLKKVDEALRQTTQHIGYELISEQASKGNTGYLANLSHFVAEDWLVSSDASRYLSKLQPKIIPKEAHQQPHFAEVLKFQLDTKVEWLVATTVAWQMLVLGRKKDRLILARVSLSGKVEYYSWKQPIDSRDQFRFVKGPTGSADVLLHTTGKALGEKVLSENHDFPYRVRIMSPIWLPQNIVGVGFDDEDKVVTVTNNCATIQVYDKEGRLKYTRDVVRDPQKTYLPVINNDYPMPMYFRKGYFYLAVSRSVVRFDLGGKFEHKMLDREVDAMEVSAPHSTLRLVLKTDQGCLLMRPDKRSLGAFGSDFAYSLVRISDMAIVSDNMILTAGERTIEVYQNQVYEQQVKLIGVVEPQESSIINVSPTNNRNQFLVITREGTVKIYDVER